MIFLELFHSFFFVLISFAAARDEFYSKTVQILRNLHISRFNENEKRDRNEFYLAQRNRYEKFDSNKKEEKTCLNRRNAIDYERMRR
jgi:hypothetical protein